MNGDTIELEASSFVAVAIRHGLLQPHHATPILDHARRANVQPSDAALTLSMLELYEVDAINLLCQPTELSPGYVLTGLIGCGAGGMVFRARQKALGRDVALKTINIRSRNASTTGQSRMQREAHAIARLHHPHIVTAYDSGFHQGRFCIAMELVEGETLADFIKRNSPISEDVVWRIARQVASALSHANDAGVTHRDIKPANLLLSDSPSGMNSTPGVPFVKVADFGLAFESEESDASQITATGTTLGTPAYVAPEQLQDTHVDARADIYSLGATVYHMLTGTPPYADSSPMRTIMQKTVGDDRWRNDLPNSVSDQTVCLFREMTETEITDRVDGYDTLISRIDQLLANPATSSSKRHPTIRQPKRIDSLLSSTATKIVIAIAVLVGVGVVATWSTGRLTHSTSVGTPSVQWIVDGFPQPLFNGQSVPLFRQSGSWSPGVENDGSRVLVGQQGSKMTIPLAVQDRSSLNTRLRISVRTPASSLVELGLLHSGKQSECGFLRFQEDTIEFSPSPDSGAASPAKTIRLPGNPVNETIFQQVAIQRQGELVLLSINGEAIGSVRCDAGAIMSVQLRCVQNASSFADIDIVGLAPTTAIRTHRLALGHSSPLR